MKALLSTIVILSYCSLAVAQINRGNFMLGGNISAHSDLIKSTANEKYTVTSVSNNATAAYFIGKNFCLGFALPFELQHYNFDYPNSEISTNTTYGIKPFTRYYIPIASSIFILTEGMGIFTHTTYKSKFTYNGVSGNSKDSGTNVGFSVGTGLAFRLNDHALLELLGSYQYTKSNNKNEILSAVPNTTNRRLFLSVGFNFLLPGK